MYKHEFCLLAYKRSIILTGRGGYYVILPACSRQVCMYVYMYVFMRA